MSLALQVRVSNLEKRVEELTWRLDDLAPAPGVKPIHRGFGKWDVIGHDGRKANETPMNKAGAEAMASHINERAA